MICALQYCYLYCTSYFLLEDFVKVYTVADDSLAIALRSQDMGNSMVT